MIGRLAALAVALLAAGAGSSAASSPRRAMTYATEAHWREIEAAVQRRRESVP